MNIIKIAKVNFVYFKLLLKNYLLLKLSSFPSTPKLTIKLNLSILKVRFNSGIDRNLFLKFNKK